MGLSSNDSIETALRAVELGYQPVAVRDGQKRPRGSSWTHTRWSVDDPDKVREYFREAGESGASGVGLLLGKASGGLIDVDFDHPYSLRVKDNLIPPSAMETGRVGRPRSHRWFMVEDLSQLPSTRQYKMPDGSMSIELRSTNGQTVIPPSIHPSGEEYRWEGEPWGGEAGPAVVDGRKLAIQVAYAGMASVLIENWPKRGSRHEAYLNLAGGLLRFGDGVHPFWERNVEVLISALADATHDDDGASTRISESVHTTINRIRNGSSVSGFPKLAEQIGNDHAEMARRMAKEIESLGGFVPEVIRSLDTPGAASGSAGDDEGDDGDGSVVSTLPPEERNPLEERTSSWEAVDLGPYLAGEVVMPEPSVLRRTDGQGLFYPGRVNSLYGRSESAKSWIALYTCLQEMSLGERVMYMDFEDEPAGTLARLDALGSGAEDIETHFRYVRPESPLAAMQKSKWGSNATEDGRMSESVFRELLQSYDPTLIVADGMTALYGLHGLDTNDAMSTDVITSWLKSLTRGGRSTVLVIDHTGKTGGQGSSPIGAHHKVAMVQGTALRADAVERPMPGMVGIVNLAVYKDRPGAVRAISTKGGREQIAATVTMDSREEGVTRMSIAPTDADNVVIGGGEEDEAKLASLARAEERKTSVIAMFEGDLSKKLSTAEVAEALAIKSSEVREVWQLLRQEGTVIREGSTRWTRFRLKGE